MELHNSYYMGNDGSQNARRSKKKKKKKNVQGYSPLDFTIALYFASDFEAKKISIPGNRGLGFPSSEKFCRSQSQPV